MKFLHYIFLLIFFISLFSFCSKKNDDEKKTIPPNSGIVSSEEMVQILEDVYLAEGAVNSKEVHANNQGEYFANRYYNYVLKKHNITSNQFMESYTYYSSNAEEMVKILELIINDLSQKQGLLQSDTKNDSPSPMRKVIK